MNVSPEQLERLGNAVAEANIPALIPMMVQMTGDTRWLEDPYLPTRNKGLDDNSSGGLPEALQSQVRGAALAAIVNWLQGRPLAIPTPSAEQLVHMLSVSMGEQVPPEYGPMIASELGVGGESYSRAPHRVKAPSDFSVIVIGAGISGVAAGVRLQREGIPYRILEKNGDVGGTWFENRYPGCGVDTPSALYSFSFAPRAWTRYFALRDELQEYVEEVATETGVREQIEFETEVVSATYDEDGQRWNVCVRRADGREESLAANAVISAVGAFGRPKMPDIPGLESFAGPAVHTARWPEDLDLRDKRVGVIGNGASAMQVVPAIAGEVESLTIFQRSPQWVAPFTMFHAEVPEPVRWLSEQVPIYRAWYRLRAAWTFNDRIHESLQKDPDWPHPERSVNEINDGHRRFFTRHIETELEGRQDLISKVVPSYPPYGKRILLDNGWFRTLTRENVALVTEPIGSIDSEGILVSDGERFDLDVVICATGFDVVRFLASLEVTGRDGRTLREEWDDDDPRAFLGTVVPGFPNFFIIYGPNTQAGHGGSLIGSAESQLNLILDLLDHLVEDELGAIECKRSAYDAYNEEVDAAHEQMVWTHPGMDTYYRNSKGRVVVNTPFRVVDFWRMTRQAEPQDYITEPARNRLGLFDQG